MILRRIHKVLAPGTNSLLRRSIFANSGYASEMFKAWQSDPKSVSDQWDQYFQKHKPEQKPIVSVEPPSKSSPSTHPGGWTSEQIKEKELVLEAFKLIRYYELRGHELATIDPLCNCRVTQRYRTTVSSARFTDMR